MTHHHRRQRRRKPPKRQRRARLWVTSSPVVQDPRELQTIVTTSCRALWGKLERHSGNIRVEADELSHKTASIANDDATDMLLCVSCPADDAAQVQAALTLVTPPHYMEDTLYRFDVVKIDYVDDDEDFK